MGRRELFDFAAKVRFRSVYIVTMLCQKQREQAGRVGCSGVKVGNAAKVEEDDDDEEDEWTEDDNEETDGN